MEKLPLIFDVALLSITLAVFVFVLVLVARNDESGRLDRIDCNVETSARAIARLNALAIDGLDVDVRRAEAPTPPPNVSVHDAIGVAVDIAHYRGLGIVPSMAEVRLREIEAKAKGRVDAEKRRVDAQQWARAEAANIYKNRHHDFTGRQMVILDAIRQAECGGRLECEDGDGGDAIGPYQIHRAYHEDSESILIDYEDCRGIEDAESVVSLYFERWAPRTWTGSGDPVEAAEYLGRIHNGGPQGATRSSTEHYGRRVRAFASTLAAERGLTTNQNG